MLVWQLAMKNVHLESGASENPLSITYPSHVAKDSLAFLNSVSIDSIVAHGPGMVRTTKIFPRRQGLTWHAGDQNLRDCKYIAGLDHLHILTL